MALIPQRFNNDCVISSVAMMLGLSYDDVFFPQVEAGFVADNDIGLTVPEVLERVGHGVEWSDRDELHYINGGLIAVIECESSPGEHHAVYIVDGELYDPGIADPYDLSYVLEHVVQIFHNPMRLEA